MTALQWLLGILHVFLILQDVKPFYFFDEETRRSEIVDTAAFFKELEMELAGSKRTNITSGTGSITFGHNWCSLALSRSSNIITARVNNQNGCNPPSVKMVLDNQFPGNNFKTTTRILDGELFGVESIMINETSHLVTMSTKVRNHQSINFVENLRVGGYVDVDTEMVFSWPRVPGMSMKNLNITITGAARLGTHKVTVELKKKPEKDNFEIKLNAPSTPIIVSAIASTFNISTEELGREGDNFKRTSIVGKTWKSWTGYGALNIDDEYQIVIEHVTGTDDNQPFDFNDVNMKFIMTRFNSWEGEAVPAYPSLLMKIPPPSHNMTTTANHFLNVTNIINLPIYGKPASKAWCMTVSPRDSYFMDTTKMQDPNTFMCAQNDGETIVEAGFNLKIKVKLKQTFQENCGATSSELGKIPEEMEIKLIMGKTGVLTHLPDTFEAPPKPTLICMGATGIPDSLFPDNIGTPVFKLIEFEFKPNGNEEEEEEEEVVGGEEAGGEGAGSNNSNNSNNSTNSRPKKKKKSYYKVAFELTLPEGYNTIPNTQIGLGNFAFSAETNEDGGWDFSASASVVLNTIYVDISLEKTSSEWVFRIDIPSMTIEDLKKLINNDQAPITSASPLRDFGILEFAFEWTFGSSTILRISGKPLLFGYDGAHLEGVYWKNKNVGPGRPANAFAFAVYFEDVNLDWILQKCTGSGKLSMKWLSKLSAVIAVSNANGVVEGAEEEEESSPSTSSGKKQAMSSTRAIVNKSLKVTKPVHHVITPRVRRNIPVGKIKSNTKNVDHGKNLKNLKKSTPASRNRDSEESDEKDPSISFDIPGMPETEIRPGLTFLFTYTVPTADAECLKNSMCEWLVKNLQRGSIQLQGYVSSKVIELAAIIRAEITLLDEGEGDDRKLLLLTDIEFKLSIGSKNPGIRLECRLRYSDPNLSTEPLIFMGAIEVDFTGSIRLEFAMGGIIEQPFGNEYLAFGNLYLSVGYSFGAVPLPSLAFAAELWLGKIIRNDPNNNAHAIKIKAGFGIDPNRPKDFWVYAEFNILTIRGICQAFELHCSGIPESVADSGFPEGLTLSYSLEERSIPVIGLEVRAGFYLKGKIKIFDLEASGEIAINPAEQSFLVDIRMAPINWVGGLIKIQRNSGDSANGPMCKIAVDSGSFDVHIEGYAEVLGINGGIKVIVTDTEFQFNVNGTMWPGIFEASIDLKATYGSWDTMSFSIVVEVRTSSLVLKIKDAIKEFCEKVGADAEKAFEDADAAFNATNVKLAAATAKVDGWKRDVNAWKDRLQIRYNQLEERKRTTQNSCKDRCPKVCFAFLDWNPRCWTFWGHWCGCLFWNSCFRMIDDIICLAGCELNKLWKKFVIWVEQIGIKIAMAMGDIANGLLSMANGVLDVAKEVVEFGRTLKNFVGDVVQGALKALAWLADVALKIFELRKLQLRASMDADFNACVGYTIDCTVFGFSVNGSGDACLNLGFIKSLVGRVVDGEDSPAELNGITDTEQNLEEAEGKKRSLADANRKLKEEEDNANKKVTEETQKNYDEEMSRRDAVPRPETLEFLKKLPKRTTVPTKEEMKYIIAANEPIPEYVKGQESIVAFESHPWFDNAEITPVGVNDKPAKDSTSTLSKRGFDFESAMSPCERMGKALSNYADVTNGLLTSAQSLKEQNITFKRTLSEEGSKIATFKQRIEQLEQRHNLTEQERQDAYFWYDKLEGGMNDFSRRSKTAMIKQDSYALPIIRNQLNYVLNAEKGSTVKEFADLIHHNAMQGYKRSTIPKHVDNGEKVLVSIKRDLVAILTNTDDPLTSMDGRLQNVKRNIESMNHHVKNCKNI